ncbi:MAG: phosphoribosylaminoimidazolesuccinocarboxamide synthase [Aaplasma endosymbiont of Hyalomma asiaticum]
MERAGNVLYEGKAKIVLLHTDNRCVIQHFKDDITAFNAQNHATLTNKGIINNKISYLLMTYLAERGIKTHLLQYLNDREQLVERLRVIPLEVVVRNIAAGSICKRLGIQHGLVLRKPLVEFYHKNDMLQDPMVTEDHITCFELATESDLGHIRNTALRINEMLIEIFADINITLVDLKLEFGLKETGTKKEVVLADEISPDTCRLWDKRTGSILDKDLYRLGSGDVMAGYREVLMRIERHVQKVRDLPW